MPISEPARDNHDSSPKSSDGDRISSLAFDEDLRLPEKSASVHPGPSNPAQVGYTGDGSETEEKKEHGENQEHSPMRSRPVSSSPVREASPPAATPSERPFNGSSTPSSAPTPDKTDGALRKNSDASVDGAGTEKGSAKDPQGDQNPVSEGRTVVTGNGVSGWSHQALASHKTDVKEHKEEDEWQDMPAFAPYDIYDDDGKLIAREERDSDGEGNAYEGLGGAGKGYTRVQVDEDALSATSMDDNTNYLFKAQGTDEAMEDDEQRDASAQLQATKDLLTEGQRIAYVGVTRLTLALMVKELDDVETTKGTKKEAKVAVESIKMWSQGMMLRLYAHMDINTSEQVMIEQLAEHGVQPQDLTPALMKNARVKNPVAQNSSSVRRSESASSLDDSNSALKVLPGPDESPDATKITSTSPFVEHDDVDIREDHVHTHLQTSKHVEIDLRWTVLCDLFLVLIADSIYDSRSRVLLERVGAALDVTWLDICRFEKRVTDSLEMQEVENKETWDESEHMENRRKMALKRKYVMMGLATVGGSLVIGLSAGLLAPVIGAGLAAGFTTIGVAGTSGFLAGAGGTALITSGAVVTGGTIAVRASHRRTGAVQTFEYRPLHNNKRVNLIVTISGWMNGKIDDVRLPYSTVDPIMGDIYSVLWEPEMLQSMGATINILATEALTQGLQQVLGSTILVALMASLQLPIVLTKLSYLIDNPWTVSLGRANAAGLILADSLIDRNLGVRPITLVGFSLGSRVIFSCLRELANRGAFGLVQNVYLFGSPIVANKDEYLRARMVVSGRFVNGYASNDWILGYLFRATSGGIMRVAGLAQVEGIPGLENIDVTKLVNGHMAYRAAMPRLLREVGWEVESDVFTEIEDPDPDNHEKRQRELIREIDEARKDAEAKPEKKRFGFFKRGKLAEKKGWEMYDDKTREGFSSQRNSSDEGPGNVLFDIEAIKAELASEQIEVRQLESTMPPMKLSLNGSPCASPSLSAEQRPRSFLRETKSYDASMSIRSKAGADPSQLSLPDVHVSTPPNRDYNNDLENFNGSGSFRNSSERVTSSIDSSRRSPSPQVLSRSRSPRGLSQERSPNLPSWQHPTVSSAEAEVEAEAEAEAEVKRLPPPPPIALSSLEHNAWLDEDDEDFGKEREVTLSFA